jgi:TIR domain/Pentapeptide repeats (8 copies)
MLDERRPQVFSQRAGWTAAVKRRFLEQMEEISTRPRMVRCKWKVFWLPGFVLRLPNCDLRNRDFYGYELVSVDFSNGSFVRSKFNAVNFEWLPGRPFQAKSNLSGCNFRSAKFVGTSFGFTSAVDSDFSHAEFNGARVDKADFRNSIFSKALIAAEFNDTDLTGADFDNAYIMGAKFTNVDLSKTRRLGKAQLYPPVTIDARSLMKSGALPRSLYRACGLTDKASGALQKILHSGPKRTKAFISYSSRDESVVKKIQSDLEDHGIETWFAPRDLPIGAETRSTLDKAVLGANKLIIVLSKRAIVSDWVQQEVELAIERDRTSKRPFLIPIRIDNAVLKSRIGWAAYLRRTRNIGDFSSPHRDAQYFESLGRLISDLEK